MALLIASGLTLGRGPGPLLRGAGFAIGERDRIGLVGANGCGKSTLLAALAGRLEIDSGDLARRRGLTTGVAEQETPERLMAMTLRGALLDALPPADRDADAWKADVALAALAIPEELGERKMAALSGGWRRLALIARAGMAEPDLLLLDEPSNHLDIARIAVLERWLLEEAGGALAIASHDRELLDRCTDRTFFLRDGALHDIPAGYGPARRILAERDLAAARARQAEEAEIERLKRSARRLASWGRQWDNEKFSRRARSIERRIGKKQAALTPVASEDRRRLALATDGARANVLLRCRDWTLRAPDGRSLFTTGRLALARGDRAVVMGANGAGKSTFMARLTAEYEAGGDRIAERAEVWFSPQAQAGHFDQALSRLPARRSVFAFFAARTSLADRHLRAELNRAGFAPADHARAIGTFSGGERARLLFLMLKLERPNLLFLDEPTTHLDIDGLERLEEEILERELTCVLASHDRRFVANVANRFLAIERGRLVELDSPEPFYAALSPP